MISYRKADIFKRIKDKQKSGILPVELVDETLRVDIVSSIDQTEYELIVKIGDCLSDAGFKPHGSGVYKYDLDPEQASPNVIDSLMDIMQRSGFEVGIERYDGVPAAPDSIFKINYKVEI